MSFTYGTFDPATTNHPILRAIRSLGFLNLKTGPWVAGGAVRRILTEEDGLHTQDIKGDIDLFLSENNKIGGSFGYTVSQVKAMLATRDEGIDSFPNEGSDKFSEYRIRSGKQFPIIQLITDRIFLSVEDCLLDFDVTVSMAATDGWRWVVHNNFIRDIGTKELVLNNGDQRKKRILRLKKYCKYGFTPTPGVFATMCGLADGKLDDSITEKGYAVVSKQYS